MIIGPDPIPNKPSVSQFMMQYALARWNAIIPPCALRITEMPTAFRYLHPTKGYRYVAKKRLQVT